MSRKVISLRAGFTMIELLMVIIIVAALGATALPQFLDFRKEAKFAAVKQFLGTMRSALKNQKAQMLLRCNASVNDFPLLAHIEMNDITHTGSGNFPSGATCTAAMIPNAADRKLLSSDAPRRDALFHKIVYLGEILGDGTPFNGSGSAYIGISTNKAAHICANWASGYGTSSIWCYEQSTGEFWADSTTYPEVIDF
jgi:prepilin-type N-terminal cleavage/methylation domain-containing protein